MKESIASADLQLQLVEVALLVRAAAAELMECEPWRQTVCAIAILVAAAAPQLSRTRALYVASGAALLCFAGAALVAFFASRLLASGRNEVALVAALAAGGAQAYLVGAATSVVTAYPSLCASYVATALVTASASMSRQLEMHGMDEPSKWLQEAASGLLRIAALMAAYHAPGARAPGMLASTAAIGATAALTAARALAGLCCWRATRDHRRLPQLQNRGDRALRAKPPTPTGSYLTHSEYAQRRDVCTKIELAKLFASSEFHDYLASRGAGAAS